MRPTGVWMVSVDQDHAFRGQYLLQLGTRSGYSTVVSRVPCARVYVVWLDSRGNIDPKLILFSIGWA